MLRMGINLWTQLHRHFPHILLVINIQQLKMSYFHTQIHNTFEDFALLWYIARTVYSVYIRFDYVSVNPVQWLALLVDKLLPCTLINTHSHCSFHRHSFSFAFISNPKSKHILQIVAIVKIFTSKETDHIDEQVFFFRFSLQFSFDLELWARRKYVPKNVHKKYRIFIALAFVCL